MMKSEKDTHDSEFCSSDQEQADCAGQELCSGDGSSAADCCAPRKTSWPKVVIFALVMLAAAAVGGYSLYRNRTAARRRSVTTKADNRAGEKPPTAPRPTGTASECGGPSVQPDPAPACCSNPNPCCGN